MIKAKKEKIRDKEINHAKGYTQHCYNLAKMMQCDCGYWYPRWIYSICPSCLKSH